MKTKRPLPKRFSGTERLSGILLGLALSLAAVSTAIAAPFAYVSNFTDPGTVSVIDIATNTVTPVPVGVMPWGVAVNPAGTRAYVANMVDNSVSVIDTATKTVETIMNVGGMPTGIAVSADGTKVYVANGDGTVAVINAADNTFVSVPAGGALGGVAVAGSSVYLTDTSSGELIVLDTTTNTTKSIFVDFTLMGLAVRTSLTGTLVYVANSNLDGELEVSVIDPAPNTPSIVTRVRVGRLGNGSGSMPGGIAVSPSGNHVYVAVAKDNAVAIVETVNHTLAGTLAVDGEPFGVAFDPTDLTGARVFVVSSLNGSVSVIDTTTNVVGPAITGGGESSLAFGAFVGGALPAPPPPPPPPPTTCEDRLKALEKQAGLKHHSGTLRAKYAQLKVALRMRAAAQKELDLAKVKVPKDPRIQRAQKEFDKGQAALCAGRYWRATHEFWDAFEVAHHILRHYRHRH